MLIVLQTPVATAAEPQPQTDPAPPDVSTLNGVWLETTYLHRSTTIPGSPSTDPNAPPSEPAHFEQTVLTGAIGGRAVFRPVVVEGVFPALIHASSLSGTRDPRLPIPTTTTSVLAGNPSLAALYQVPNADIRFGAGVTLPLAGDDSAEHEPLGYDGGPVLAVAANGNWNVWWYSPDTMTVFFPAEARAGGDDELVVAAEAAFGLLVPVSENADDALAIAAQVGGFAGYSFGELRAGAWLRQVLLPNREDEDFYRATFEPTVEAKIGHWRFGTSLLVDVEGPERAPLAEDSLFKVRTWLRFEW